MEVLALVALLGGVLAGTWAFLWKVPFGTWTFRVAGRTIVVRNMALVEKIEVDGELAQNTRTGGNYLTEAEHTVVIDGEPLRVRIHAADLVSMACDAWHGERQVFSSHRSLETKLAVPQIEDPRRAAVQALLEDLARSESARVRDAATTLRKALDAVFKRLPLGKEADEAELERLIDVLHELHIAATADAHAEAMSHVDDALDRLDATSEIEGLARKHRASQALKKKT